MSARRRRALRRIGLGMCVAAVGTGLLIVFCALPPFHTGIWYQSEPVAAALHGVAAVAAFGLAVMVLARSRGAARALAHPFVLLPLALALWSLIAAPFADVALLSWFGTPEHGQGIAWFLDLALLTAAAIALQPVRRARRALAWTALAAAGVAAALTIHTEAHWRWAPFDFYDYLAFYGLFAIAIGLGQLRPKSTAGRLATIGYGAAIVLLSGNRSAIALLAAVAPLAALATWWLERHRPRWARLAPAAAVPVVMLAMVPVVLALGRDAPDTGLGSRALHLQVVGASLADDTRLALAGRGWGHYGERLLTHMPLDRIDLRGGPGGGSDWDAARGQIHFHSHHGGAEALISAGLVAIVLWVGYLAVLPVAARRDRIVLAATLAITLAGLFSLWFQLPGSVPYMALALGGLAGVRRRWRVSNAGFGAIGLAALVAAIALAASSAWVLRDAARAAHAVADNKAGADSPGGCDAFLNDHGRGGIHLANLYRDFVLRIDQANADPVAARLERFHCAYRRDMGRPHSLRLGFAGLVTAGEFANWPQDAPLPATMERIAADLATDLVDFMRAAPNRSDAAILYLVARVRDDDFDAVRRLSEDILARDRGDPVGLWFSGMALLAAPETSREAVGRMRRALARGIEKIVPVDGALKEMLLETPPE